MVGEGVAREEGVGAQVDVEVEDARVRLGLLHAGQGHGFVAIKFRMLERIQVV